MVSVEVGGPHESSEGREEMMSESDIGAMIATCWWSKMLGFAIVVGAFDIFECVDETLGS